MKLFLQKKCKIFERWGLRPQTPQASGSWGLRPQIPQTAPPPLRISGYAPARGQGHKNSPRPRPRTAFPRTEPLEAKDRNARGQGQGPRTQAQAFSQKKGLQNFFSGDLQFIGVPRIFDWGRPKAQITRNDVIKIFPKRKFLWDKDIVGWKI